MRLGDTYVHELIDVNTMPVDVRGADEGFLIF